MTQEDIRAIGALMDQKLAPIVNRLDTLEENQLVIAKRLDTLEENQLVIIKRLDTLEESQEETRNGVNMLISWSEKVSMAATFPLPDIDD